MTSKSVQQRSLPFSGGPATNVRMVTIGPDTAAEMLRSNHTNRPLRPKKVRQYVEDMTAGRWKDSFDPIRFGRSGRLIDGQHRLHAIVAAGVTLQMLVVYDVDDSAFDVFDNGAPRTLADMLVIEGYEGWVARTGASAAQIAIAIANGMVPGNTSAANNVARQFVLDNPELMTSVEFLGSLPRKGVPMSHSIGAALHLFMNRLDPSLAERFFRGLFLGEGLHEGDVLLELRNRLIARVIAGTISRRDSMAATIRVWNSMRVGRPIKHIGNAFRTDTFPVIR